MNDQEKTEVSTVILDMWGIATSKNREACCERTQKWKPILLALAHQVHQAMKLYETCPESKLQAKWFITDGTLLGAYRDGKMIPHDYDFDFGVCFFTEEGNMADLDKCRKEVFKVAQHLSSSLDNSYTILPRADDYACKIEIQKKSSGVLLEKKGEWFMYNIHMDLQMCYTSDQTKFEIAYFRNNYSSHVSLDISNVFPLSEIEFESTTWPCPKHPKTMLEALYGYIGMPAKFNPKTWKYEPFGQEDHALTPEKTD